MYYNEATRSRVRSAKCGSTTDPKTQQYLELRGPDQVERFHRTWILKLFAWGKSAVCKTSFNVQPCGYGSKLDFCHPPKLVETVSNSWRTGGTTPSFHIRLNRRQIRKASHLSLSESRESRFSWLAELKEQVCDRVLIGCLHGNWKPWYPGISAPTTHFKSLWLRNTNASPNTSWSWQGTRRRCYFWPPESLDINNSCWRASGLLGEPSHLV